MLLILPVNKTLIRDRKDLTQQLSKLYSFLLSNWAAPTDEGPLQERVNYATLLLSFSALAAELE